MDIRDFQENMARIYLSRDSRRGVWGTFGWLVEEVGELSRAIRAGEAGLVASEFADVMAWLASLANLCGVDLDTAVSKYGPGCPRCGSVPCSCP